ncbi:MAG: T9SS type A sorting domain-containing protein [Bacteroidales bacterium]|jgi:photosystem II stability/assembly factor-like uncharacterized protein
MKKLFTLFAFLVLCNFFVNAQWTQLSTKTKSDLDCINIVNNTIFTGGDSLRKTTNNGTSWANYPWGLASYLYDIHFFDGNIGLSTGMYIMSNALGILRTTNGGQMWEAVYEESTSGFSQLNSFSFPSSSIGYVAGERSIGNGVIFKTINGGLSWNELNTGASVELKSVFFTSNTTGFAVGSNTILKTTNGGSTWSSTAVNSYLTSIHFCNSLIGYTSADGDATLKTTDGGNTWNDLKFYSSGPIYAYNKDTVFVVANKSLYITRDGGLYWERFITLNNNNINKIYFNNTDGYLVCDTGKLYKTTNFGGYSAPITSFSFDDTYFCKDSLVNFLNISKPSYTFTWKLNGKFLANTYNTSYTFTNPSQNDTITLISYNGHYYDSLTKIIYVQSSLDFTLNTTQDKDTICPSTSANISVLNSVSGVTYQLRNGTTNIGSSKSGNGNTLIFNTGNITSTTTFNILATKTNSCGSKQKTDYHIIVVAAPNKTLTVSAVKPVVCYGDSAFITVALSEIGFTYQLKNGSTNVGTPVKGNGATIYLKTEKITATVTFSVYVTNKFGCSATLSQTQQVTYRNYTVGFQTSIGGYYVGDTISLSNTSTADNYVWIFDSTASKNIDSSNVPNGIKYDSTGRKTIRLIGITNEGCRDTIDKEIFIFNKAPYGQVTACSFDSLKKLISPEKITAIHIDEKQNVYIASVRMTNKGSCYVDGSSDDNFVFQKFDSHGNLLWEKIPDHYKHGGCSYSFISSIANDDEGNVYIAGTFNRFLAIDTVSVLAGEDSDNGCGQLFVIKYNCKGDFKWIVYSKDGCDIYGRTVIGISDLKYYNNNLYFACSGYNASKSLIQANNTAFPPPTGNFYKMSKNGMIIKKYFSNYIDSLKRYNDAWWHNSGYEDAYTYEIAPKIKFTNNNLIYLYNSQRVYLLDTSFNFIKRTLLFGTTPNSLDVPLLIFDNKNNFYTSISWDLTGKGCNPLSLPGKQIKGNLLSKYDYNGTLIWNNINPYFSANGLEFSNDSNLILYGSYNDFLSINSQNKNVYGETGNSTKQTAFISLISNSGNLQWIMPTGFVNIQSYGGTYTDYKMLMTSDNFGMKYFTGSTNYKFGFGNDSINKGFCDPLKYTLFLAKFSDDGTCINQPIDSSCNIIPTNIENKIFNKNQINIYPNPANTQITIELPQTTKQSTIIIYNISGEETIKAKGIRQKTKVDISNLQSGIYFIKIVNEDGVSVGKFIKNE